MDLTKEQLAQEQLDALKEALKNPSTLDNMGAVSGTHGYESILSTPGQDTITISSLGGTYNNNTMIGAGYNTNYTGLNYPNTISGGPYTISSGTATANWATPITTDGSGQINLTGEKADVVINGVSLMEVLRDRLNVMIPNPKLEKEWEELKALGDQYRALEAKLKEQGEMWAKLKAMPPVDPLY